MNQKADQIFKEFLLRIQRLKDIKHPKVVICFSAVPGSGKTWLADRLEKDLNAVNISNDEIRITIEKAGVTDRNTRERLKEAVIQRVNKEVVTWPNGLIIMDADVSRRFTKMVPNFADYKIIVIAIDASKQLCINRIRQREGHRADPVRTIELLDRWLADKANFEKEFGARVDIRLDADKGFDYPEVLERIISEVKA